MGEHRGRLRRLLRRRWAWVLGAAVVVPLVAVDPAMLALVFDVEFLMVVGAVGARMTRQDLAMVWQRFLSSSVVMDCRAGVALSREDPRSLLTG